MKRHSPPLGSGSWSETKVRATGKRSHTRSDNGRASRLTSSPFSPTKPATGRGGTDQLGPQVISRSQSQQSPIYAEIFGSNYCTAEGISARG